MILPFALPPFVSKWGLTILAGLLAVGFGLGFWLYVKEINDDRRDAEAAVVRLQSENEGLKDAAIESASRIDRLTVRLDAEQVLAQTRLESEQSRRLAAESRNGQFAGALNDLRIKLAPLACGIGSDLSDGLRDARDAREAERRSRENGG